MDDMVEKLAQELSLVTIENEKRKFDNKRLKKMSLKLIEELQSDIKLLKRQINDRTKKSN